MFTSCVVRLCFVAVHSVFHVQNIYDFPVSNSYPQKKSAENAVAAIKKAHAKIRSGLKKLEGGTS